VELPFIVVFEPPSRAELRAVMRMRRTWLAGGLAMLAIGALGVVLGVGRAEAGTNHPAVPLELHSRPPGAAVWLDGRERGRTPLEVLVAPGAHSVVFKAADAVDGEYALDVGAEPAELDARLLRRQPTLTRLRPTLPGAVLSSVRLLADGELALVISVPPGRQLQAWRFDPDTGGVEPVVKDALGSRLALAADGQHTALVGFEVGPPRSDANGDAVGFSAGRASVLWLGEDGRGAPATGWRPPLAPGEDLLDASWSPHVDRLLAVTGQVQGGETTRSRLWLVDADGQASRVLLSLPSQVVPGSEVWSPDARHVAFVAHAGEVNALCLVDLDGGFRYVADLDPSPSLPLAYPPLTWSADGQRMLFVAPRQHPPGTAGSWLQPEARHALYAVSTADPTPVFLSDTDVDLPAWREDGQMLGLGRFGADGGLAVRQISGPGNGHRLVDLPLKPAAGYAAMWDLDRGFAVVASPRASGDVEYWLATLGLGSPR
jgi:hypothetical protein